MDATEEFIIETKRCPVCGEVKSISEFSKDKGKKDGLYYNCKKCDKERHRKYYNIHKSDIKLKTNKYYYKNHSKMREKQKQYRDNNPEFISELKKKWQKENKDKESERKKKIYVINKDEILKKQRRYYNCNKYVVTERNKNYRKTLKGQLAFKRAWNRRRNREIIVDNTLTIGEWEIILKSQKNKCNICGKQFTKNRKPTMDHIIPLSKGGGLTYENVQALCKSCNSKKSNRLDKNFIHTWVYLEERT